MDSLCGGAKMFQQMMTCVAGDHLSRLGRACCLGMRAAFLPAGSALVDWLISNSFAVSRFEAITLASMLMEENFIKPVGARSTEATRYSDLSEQFLDDSTALYMFVSDTAAKRHLLCPSSHAWFGAVVKGTRTACNQRWNTQATEANIEGAALGF